MTTTQTHTVSNGVDLESLGKTVKAIQDNPALGKSTFHARNKWMSGGHNRTHVTCFRSLGAEHSHAHPFDLDADEPKALGGTDQGANPVEHLLNALAACVTTSLVAHAAVRGIEIEEVESQLDGDIDLRGFLGLDPTIPKGYQDIRVRFKIKTAAENLRVLKELAAFSPVYNTLVHGCRVDVQIALK